MITKGQVWQHKETGERVTVVFVSDELVTYIKAGTLTPMRKFIFLQDFEVCE